MVKKYSEKGIFMEINTAVENGRVTVTLTGRMYVEEATILREKLIGFMDEGKKHFEIKIANVDYIDSSGLGVLVAIQKRALQVQGGVKIIGATGIVKELFELTRLNKIFEMQ